MTRPVREHERQFFRSHPVFGRLDESELDELLAHAHVEHYTANSEIFAKGSSGQTMMVVVRGRVRVSSPSAEGKEVTLNIFSSGQIFGEIAVLDGRERTAAATAMTDCELLVVYRRDFLPLLVRRGDICFTLLEILCQRLRQTSEQVEDVLFNDLGSRVAKALLRLAENTHSDVGPVSAHLRVTQLQLSSLVGGSRESVNRQLQRLARAGLITLGKGSISIHNLTGLQREV
jgi:CRP-like cAMP-binding protein